MIDIMFGGVAGVLAAKRVIRVFAGGCGFSKKQTGRPVGVPASAIHKKAMGGKT